MAKIEGFRLQLQDFPWYFQECLLAFQYPYMYLSRWTVLEVEEWMRPILMPKFVGSLSIGRTTLLFTALDLTELPCRRCRRQRMIGGESQFQVAMTQLKHHFINPGKGKTESYVPTTRISFVWVVGRAEALCVQRVQYHLRMKLLQLQSNSIRIMNSFLLVLVLQLLFSLYTFTYGLIWNMKIWQQSCELGHI